LDLRWTEIEIDRLDRVRRSAEAAASSYVRALTAATRAGRQAPAPDGLRASRAELRKHQVELSHRLDRVADLAFPSPCDAAPLAFAFAAARATLASLDRLCRPPRRRDSPSTSQGRRLSMSR
jgi:hypothetical protein